MNDGDIPELFAAELEEHCAVARAAREKTEAQFKLVLQAWIKCIKNRGKILLFGNGGSASQAEHLSTELVVRYGDNRPPIAAIALTSNTAILTGSSNDLGYDQVFARQIEALGRPGDLACGFSTSGRSPNVNLALRAALQCGLAVAGMTGGDGGEMAQIVEALIVIPSRNTARIQEMHLVLGHMLCLGLERELKYV
jgi:D-sedoheptulose 7-phosphate isomerase